MPCTPHNEYHHHHHHIRDLGQILDEAISLVDFWIQYSVSVTHESLESQRYLENLVLGICTHGEAVARHGLSKRFSTVDNMIWHIAVRIFVRQFRGVLQS